MKSTYCIVIMILLTNMSCLCDGIAHQWEEIETVEPLLRRPPLRHLRTISLKQKASSRFDKYKRCLWTGPCMQQELDETKRDIQRGIMIAGALMGITLFLRYQYSTVKAAGEKPTWCFPMQWWQLDKKQHQQEVTHLEEKMGKIEDTTKDLSETLKKFVEKEKELKKEEAEIAKITDQVKHLEGEVQEIKEKNEAVAVATPQSMNERAIASEIAPIEPQPQSNGWFSWLW